MAKLEVPESLSMISTTWSESICLRISINSWPRIIRSVVIFRLNGDGETQIRMKAIVHPVIYFKDESKFNGTFQVFVDGCIEVVCLEDWSGIKSGTEGVLCYELDRTAGF